MNINRNEIKLVFEPAVFTVNTKKGIVTCVLRYRILIPEISSDGWNDNKKNNSRPLNGTGFYTGQYDKVLTSIGMAKCGPDDTFDEKIGKEIAEARAENGAYMTASNKVAALFTFLSEKFYEWSDQFAQKGQAIWNHNENYIASMGKQAPIEDAE